MSEVLALVLAMDGAIGTRSEIEDGVYTGRLDGRSCTGRERRAALHGFAQTEGIDLASSWAYSDSASDLPMLEAVGHPVAVNPDGAARRGRPARGLGGASLREAWPAPARRDGGAGGRGRGRKRLLARRSSRRACPSTASPTAETAVASRTVPLSGRKERSIAYLGRETLKGFALDFDVDPDGDLMKPGNSPPERAFQVARSAFDLLVGISELGFPSLDRRTQKRGR